MGGLGYEVEGSRPGEARPEDAVRIRNERNVPAHARSLGVVPPSLDRWAEDAGQTRARRLNTSYSAQADHRRTIRVLTQTACEPRGTNSWVLTRIARVPSTFIRGTLTCMACAPRGTDSRGLTWSAGWPGPRVVDSEGLTSQGVTDARD